MQIRRRNVTDGRQPIEAVVFDLGGVFTELLAVVARGSAGEAGIDPDAFLALHREVGFILDQVMSTTHAVWLLSRREAAADIALAVDLASDATALVADTQLLRAKRLLNEAMSELPS